MSEGAEEQGDTEARVEPTENEMIGRGRYICIQGFAFSFFVSSTAVKICFDLSALAAAPV